LIPLNEEKFKSITKQIGLVGNKNNVPFNIRFIDSLNFMGSSIDKLANDIPSDGFGLLEKYMRSDPVIRQKGVFPYQWIDSLEKLNETCIPPKEKLFSTLTGKGITEKEYARALAVFDKFECKTMWDYARLYLKTDVLILAVVFEGFRDMSIREYGLDPAWSFSAPGLSWDAMLKFTGIHLELITDPDMHLMFTKGIRGGNCMAVTRYAEVNFKGMGDAYNPKKENSYFRDWDKNNLYGGAMSGNLPYAGFRWMDDEELENWELTPCVVEMDLKYPESLHDFTTTIPYRLR
jgi:hypothetical protein